LVPLDVSEEKRETTVRVRQEKGSGGVRVSRK